MNLDEFLKHSEANAKAVRSRERVPAQVIEFRRTAVALEYLTGDESWDRYLEILETKAQEIEGEIVKFRDLIENPDTDPKDVSDLQRKLIGNKLIAKTIRECMAVPKMVAAISNAIPEGDQIDAG